MLDSDWWTTRELSLSTAHLSDNVHKPCFHFKMANIMMKTQQDKMALMFLIVEVCGSLNMYTEAVVSSEATGVISWLTIKKLSAKKYFCTVLKTTVLDNCKLFFRDNFYNRRQKEILNTPSDSVERFTFSWLF